MKKIILSGGYYHKAYDGGKSFCDAMVQDIHSRPIKVLDCLFGRSHDTWEQKIRDDEQFFSKNIENVELVIASPENFIEQIEHTDILFFQGSRPEDMMSILDTIPGWEKVLDNKVIVGSSGGASLLAKYFGVGKSTSGQPRLGKGLGIVPIKFISHWKSDHGIGFEADWEGLYHKISNHQKDLEVIRLADGEFKTFIIQ
jgi:hypothetical protein